MQENTLIVTIEKPVAEVFDFTINPENTPWWVDGITEEQVNKKPIRKGTIYKNRGEQGNWHEFEVTKFEPNEIFELRAKDGNYNVRYSYTPLSEFETKLEYHEWTEEGDIEKPFSQGTLETLKTLLED